jgi:hypothetical protein
MTRIETQHRQRVVTVVVETAQPAEAEDDVYDQQDDHRGAAEDPSLPQVAETRADPGPQPHRVEKRLEDDQPRLRREPALLAEPETRNLVEPGVNLCFTGFHLRWHPNLGVFSLEQGVEYMSGTENLERKLPEPFAGFVNWLRREENNKKLYLFSKIDGGHGFEDWLKFELAYYLQNECSLNVKLEIFRDLIEKPEFRQKKKRIDLIFSDEAQKEEHLVELKVMWGNDKMAQSAGDDLYYLLRLKEHLEAVKNRTLQVFAISICLKDNNLKETLQGIAVSVVDGAGLDEKSKVVFSYEEISAGITALHFTTVQNGERSQVYQTSEGTSPSGTPRQLCLYRNDKGKVCFWIHSPQKKNGWEICLDKKTTDSLTEQIKEMSH